MVEALGYTRDAAGASAVGEPSAAPPAAGPPISPLATPFAALGKIRVTR